MARRSGFFDIPQVKRKPWGALCALLDILPGVGTFVLGLHAKHRPSLIVGALQFVSAIALIGFVWSWAWGVGIWLRSGRGAPT